MRWVEAMSTDLLEAVRHEIFSVSSAFFADVFQVVCVTSKNVQHRHGLKVDLVRGMVNVSIFKILSFFRRTQ